MYTYIMNSMTVRRLKMILQTLTLPILLFVCNVIDYKMLFLQLKNTINFFLFYLNVTADQKKLELVFLINEIL